MNWQPIENVPKPVGFVLISNSHHWLKAYWNCAINEWCDEDGEQLFGMKPTHFCIVTPPGERQQSESVNQRLLDAAEKARIELMWLIEQHKPREGGSVMRAYEELRAAIDAAKQAKQ